MRKLHFGNNGGALKYPILTKYLPTSNDGILPSPFAKSALNELNRLEKELETANKYDYIIKPLKNLANASILTGNPIHWS